MMSKLPSPYLAGDDRVGWVGLARDEERHGEPDAGDERDHAGALHVHAGREREAQAHLKRAPALVTTSDRKPAPKQHPISLGTQ